MLMDKKWLEQEERQLVTHTRTHTPRQTDTHTHVQLFQGLYIDFCSFHSNIKSPLCSGYFSFFHQMVFVTDVTLAPTLIVYIHEIKARLDLSHTSCLPIGSCCATWLTHQGTDERSVGWPVLLFVLLLLVLKMCIVLSNWINQWINQLFNQTIKYWWDPVLPEKTLSLQCHV